MFDPTTCPLLDYELEHGQFAEDFLKNPGNSKDDYDLYDLDRFSAKAIADACQFIDATAIGCSLNEWKAAQKAFYSHMNGSPELPELEKELGL